MQTSPHAHGSIAHVAINADDLGKAQAFYAALFGWSFAPWGPPGFFLISVPGSPHMNGALQQRRELREGVRSTGFECTVAVDDLDATLAAAVAHGGRVVMDRTTIPSVCELAFIEDPSGNVVGVAQYDDAAT